MLPLCGATSATYSAVVRSSLCAAGGNVEEEELTKWRTGFPRESSVNMASTQEPEVQLAQRLASNEKPVRTKAVKKLRKYINVRSHNATGGFSSDELLKLWKGLFYCLWMQDKPLLQAELSNQISTLIHSFHNIDGQLLYLESFLLTFKREWTGIDRLRMDKFFQLVRFMFRQTFEMLKKKQWEHSVVGRFLELLNTQLLQSSSAAPSGLQLHILDLYMTELAAVGSAELTADQNLTFIEPFCKTAARTKDQTLFRAICSSILSTIIDQAPFAIEDLMKELKADQTSDCDSGQASEEDSEEEQKETRSKAAGKKRKGKQINGNTPHEEEEDDSDDADLHLEDSYSEVSCDEDVGPVLQFDYAALADKLFELASRSSTPSRNRQRLYKITKILRDLSEGIFPQDEYPEEVSTDEDDDMFGSRKRIKTGGRPTEEEEEGGPPAAKKRKKKDVSTPNKQSKQSGKDASEPADLTCDEIKKKKRKKRKKKVVQGRSKDGEENTVGSEQTVAEAQRGIKETEGPWCSQTEHVEKEAQTQSCLSSVKVTEAAPPEGHTETLLLSAVTEDSMSDKDKSEEEKTKAAEEQQTPGSTEPVMPPEADTTVCGKKKKKKKNKKKDLKEKLQMSETVAEQQVNADKDIIPVNYEEPAEKNAVVTPQSDATTPAKNLNQSESQVNGVSAEAECPSKCCEDSEEGGAANQLEEPADSTTPCSKKRKKKNLKAEGKAQIMVDTETKSADEETSRETSTVPLKKKTNKRGKQGLESSGSPLGSNQEGSKTAVEEEGVVVETPQLVDAEVTMTTPSKRKKKKLAGAELPLGEAEVVSETPARKKKRKIPVEFEYEVDELEAAAAEATSISGLAEETVAKKSKPGSDIGESSTPLHNKKSQKKAKASSRSASDFMTFQSKATIPTPLFCKSKRSPSTQLSSKKKSQTPKSESKKVTFGLKNNKTTEFCKTDRSLLVSPDGSSRVPFDPKQKPKFGVLKSPSTPASSRKTARTSRKSSCSAPKSTLKQRPRAADFF